LEIDPQNHGGRIVDEVVLVGWLHDVGCQNPDISGAAVELIEL
jgi:hypothetical protein